MKKIIKVETKEPVILQCTDLVFSQKPYWCNATRVPLKMSILHQRAFFEYDDKREKELIRKAEYSEGMKEGERIGREAGKKEEAERIFKIYQLFRANYTENQIKEKLGMNVEEVRKILERFK